MKILLVDDEKEITDILSVLLEDEDHSVEVASNGKEALTKLRSEKFDLLILDNQMPILSGEEVLDELYKERIDGLKIIFASGQSMSLLDLVEKNQHFELVDYLLNKPYKVELIEAAISELL